jgi:hypothetical protein
MASPPSRLGVTVPSVGVGTKADFRVAETDHVAVDQPVFIDSPTVDAGAVRRTEISDPELRVDVLDLGMAPAHATVHEPDPRVAIPADQRDCGPSITTWPSGNSMRADPSAPSVR